jgi:octaprenyl-diphosphate synthase
MAIKLSEIKNPIAAELGSFEKHFKETMKSPVPLLDKIMYYIVQRKGKQIRPMFVFLSAKICGEVGEATYTAASLVELLHTATLVHDDVVDDAYKRRGYFSINALWKNKIAVLVGDYLLSRGLLLALDNEQYKLLQILSKAVKEMSEGELLQIEKARRLDIKESVYYEIIRQKTASLIAAACSSGAASTTEDPAAVEHFRLIGESIGIAFQIKDDLLDYGEYEIGKPRAIDIKEKKMTLPLIYALKKASPSERRRHINTVKHHGSDKKRVSETIEFVKKSGGMEYARDAMDQYKQKALELLTDLPLSDSKAALIQLINFVIDRKK